MATRERIIEGKWTCAQCDSTGIRGRLKRCPFCGSPREAGEAKFDFGKADEKTGKRDAETVTDVEGIAMAGEGKDWFCANCDTSNKSGAGNCVGCGASHEHAALSAPLPPEEPPPPPVEEKSSGGGGLWGLLLASPVALAILAIVLLSCCCLGWMSTSKQVDGAVTAQAWQRTITVETFTAVTKQGWKSELKGGPSKMPVQGSGEHAGVDNVRGCVTKEKSPAKCEQKTKKVECGTEEKCTTKDLGNGFAKEVCEDVPKFCEEKYEECTAAVIDEQCTYDTYEWKPGVTSKAEAKDNKPIWPNPPSIGAQDRLKRDEKLTITVSWDGNTGDYAAKDEGEFTSWKVGDKAKVSVNGFGAVTGLQRP